MILDEKVINKIVETVVRRLSENEIEIAAGRDITTVELAVKDGVFQEDTKNKQPEPKKKLKFFTLEEEKSLFPDGKPAAR